MNHKLNVDVSWSDFFISEQKKPYFKILLNNIKKEYENYQCFPSWNNIFAAFNFTKLDTLKVVILGQDPYHQPNQAHGLAFSVLPGVTLPPSLKNIYKELKSDINVDNGNDGYLLPWAKKGVFLLNTSLSVRYNQPNSHSKLNWSEFTDNVLQYLSDNKTNLVFILWGNNARAKKALIDSKKHLIIENVHPSPLSANNGFFGSKPFSKTNKWLIDTKQTPIDWKLSNYSN